MEQQRASIAADRNAPADEQLAQSRQLAIRDRLLSWSLADEHPQAPTRTACATGTISNVVCSSALCFTMAPTEQYFSSESRMASSTAWRGNVIAGHDVMNANLGEDLRRIGSLVSLDLYFVSRYLLALLAQDVDDVEGGASGQGDGNQFDRLGAGIAGRIVDQQMMSGTAGGYELAMSAFRLESRLRWQKSCVLRVCRAMKPLGKPITSGYRKKRSDGR